MRNIIHWGCLSLSLLFAVSCQEETLPLSNGSGIEITIKDAAGADTRSLPEPVSDELAQLFSLQIRDDAKNWYKGTMQDYAASNTLFAPGAYHLTAWYGLNQELALDQPYYVSEMTDVVVEANKTAQATVLCHVGNAMASFAFADAESAAAILKSYEIVTEVNGQTVSCTVDDGHNPYFQSGKTAVFYLKGETSSGKSVDYKFAQIDQAEARKNYKFTLSLSEANTGEGSFEVDVQKDVEEISINATVPDEFLPKPAITTEGFAEGNVLDYYETSGEHSLRCNLSAYKPLEDLELTLIFADENLHSLNKTYLLSEMTAEEKESLRANGIVLPDLDGVQKDGTVDLSELVTRLHSNDDASPVANSFNLRVKANGRWSTSTIGYINILKPDFSVKVYPGDVWTKEMTVTALRNEDVVHGNADNLKSDLKYQISANGSDWKDLGTDLKGSSLTPGTEYYVRALYRNAISSQVQKVRTYENLQIPNETFDDGYDVSYPKSKNPLYTFKGGWIGTRNPMTCHSDGINAFYVSKSGTLPVTDDGRNVAHMMTLGWGAGNTCMAGLKSLSIIYNVSAGLVCVGSFDASQNTVSALSAYARPTALKFTYRAEPYSDDEYLIQISLEHHEGDAITVIGSGKLQTSEKVTSYQDYTLPVSYNDQYKDLAITHIKIEFYSGTKEDRDHLESKFRDGIGTYAYIIGSQFWLDGFSLVYDK